MYLTEQEVIISIIPLAIAKFSGLLLKQGGSGRRCSVEYEPC